MVDFYFSLILIVRISHLPLKRSFEIALKDQAHSLNNPTFNAHSPSPKHVITPCYLS